MLLESTSMIKKALGNNVISTIRSLDVLPRERRKTQKFRASMLVNYTNKCCLCLNIFESKQLEAAHVVPLQLGAKTTESNLVLLCKKCHIKYDTGYMSISDMINLQEEWINGKRTEKILLNNIKIPQSEAITPAPEKVKSTLEEIRIAQTNNKPVVGINIAKSALENFDSNSTEYKRLRIKIAELMRRRTALGTLKQSRQILESIDVAEK